MTDANDRVDRAIAALDGLDPDTLAHADADRLGRLSSVVQAKAHALHRAHNTMPDHMAVTFTLTDALDRVANPDALAHTLAGIVQAYAGGTDPRPGDWTWTYSVQADH